MSKVGQTEKNGEKIDRNCSESIKFYNQKMGRVDVCDHLVAVMISTENFASGTDTGVRSDQGTPNGTKGYCPKVFQ